MTARNTNAPWQGGVLGPLMALLVTSSCATLCRASSFAMSADNRYGTSVSSVPWTSSVGGYPGETFRTGQ